MLYILYDMTTFIYFMKIMHNVYYIGIYFLSSIPLIKNRIFILFLYLPKKSAYNILLVLRKKNDENVMIRLIFTITVTSYFCKSITRTSYFLGKRTIMVTSYFYKVTLPTLLKMHIYLYILCIFTYLCKFEYFVHICEKYLHKNPMFSNQFISAQFLCSKRLKLKTTISFTYIFFRSTF